ncbi:MAG: hypothetical protein ACYS80_09940 [Planctomycetota bacterium]
MKQISTITSVIIAVVVLLAALGIGLCIREIRLKRAGVASGGDEVQSPIPAPGGGERKLAPSPEDRAKLVEERAELMERFENMSEEEREQFRAQTRERFAGRRPEGREGFQRLSEEERTKMREEVEKMREGWEEMSEEEREEVRAKMRERFGGRRPRGGGEGGRRRPGGMPDLPEQ